MLEAGTKSSTRVTLQEQQALGRSGSLLHLLPSCLRTQQGGASNGDIQVQSCSLRHDGFLTWGLRLSVLPRSPDGGRPVLTWRLEDKDEEVLLFFPILFSSK